MKKLRLASLVCGAGVAAMGQQVAPVAPTPATPPSAPMYPAAAPAVPTPRAYAASHAGYGVAAGAYAAIAPQVAVVPPVPPMATVAPLAPLGWDGQTPMVYVDREQIEQAREVAQQVREQQREIEQQAREQQREAQQQVREQQREMEQQARGFAGDVWKGQNFNFNFDANVAVKNMTLLQPKALVLRGPDSMLYSNGQSAIDAHRYDQALENFTEVVNRGGPRTEGALYWKAYSLNKLGKRDDAIAAIGQLRSKYPNSKWLDEAKALEFEIQQANGKPASPEAQGDDELKLLALNGLVQSDPERALPYLDKLLKGPASPALKKRAVFVLANSTSPKAQQSLEQIARGSLGNPDLQLVAISYMLTNKNQPNRNQTLQEIYNSSNDAQVKRAILSAYRGSQDYDRLFQIAKTEKDQDLKRAAVEALSNKTGQPELWQIYGSDSPEGKAMILRYMHQNGNTDKLAELVRTEKDPTVRAAALSALADQRESGPNTTTMLINLYSADQDPQIKRTIINAVAERRNVKALGDIYHKETGLELKKVILSRLAGIHSPEANELYLEILKP